MALIGTLYLIGFCFGHYFSQSVTLNLFQGLLFKIKFSPIQFFCTLVLLKSLYKIFSQQSAVLKFSYPYDKRD